MENITDVYSDRVSYLIMNCLYNRKITSKANSYTLKEIHDALAEDGNKYNIRTISYKIKELLQLNLINEGMKKKNAFAFYLAQSGLNAIMELEHNEVEIINSKEENVEKTTEDQNNKREFLIILDMGKDFTIPIHIMARNSADAMLKASTWSVNEGYFPLGMKAHLIQQNIGIIEIR